MSGSWENDSGGSIETPFDIEAILRADPALLEAWKRKPFYLDLGYDGAVVLKYWEDLVPHQQRPSP